MNSEEHFAPRAERRNSELLQVGIRKTEECLKVDLLLKENSCVFAKSKVVEDLVELDLRGDIDHGAAAWLEGYSVWGISFFLHCRETVGLETGRESIHSWSPGIENWIFFDGWGELCLAHVSAGKSSR